MAFGGTEETGLLPGPWNSNPGEGSPIWGWSGDEETLPLLIPEMSEDEPQESERILVGPWEHKSTNPFETDVLLPLSEPLLPQEKSATSFHGVPSQLPKLINAETCFDLKTSPGLLGQREDPLIEPSHMGHNYCKLSV